MAELKTKENSASVLDFITSLEDTQKRDDALVLLKLFEKITKKKAKMWGSSIVGFGNIHYKYASGREGDWMATGFSPRKANLSLYVLGSFEGKAELLAKLGPHKTGKSCLYVKRLADIDMKILEELIKKSYVHAITHQTVC
jgi:nucleoid DNA-binding protein